MGKVGDELLRYEEDNFEALINEFLKDEKIAELWEDFVYDSFIDTIPDEPPEE